ncbi:E3 ubiquitin ligase TRAF3IP2 [Lampris incognitus]|uniref:E3 ubiquitin ligase TRAF3IP2 n=1 Tax=Lampris incognitus TaxID=2546036 RepID=UPI0024B57E0A|nr:E3 ubiquitin ligase TRAF3IP2 [Lampris incognitus]
MSGGRVQTMRPTSLFSASALNSHIDQLGRYSRNQHNTPEEDDETMSKDECEGSAVPKPDSSTNVNRHSTLTTSLGDPLCSRPELMAGQGHERSPSISQSVPSYCPYQPPHGLPAGYSQPTPFPSQVEGSWLHPSFASGWSGAHYPSSLPSLRTPKDFPSFSGESSYSRNKYFSLPGRYSPSMSSLEQPHSLHSNPLSKDMYRHTLFPYCCSPQGAACCAQCPADPFTRAPMVHRICRPGYHPGYGPPCPNDFRFPPAAYMPNDHISPAKHKNLPYSTPLSLEQRKVFVTYEADNDKHVNEIINFVALLRHNGFDTHIDMFEQQFRSISKIDFMERYLSEKEYLIIIIISPKYYETVTASPVSLENDERTFNTVYIHKQLQNEFIQNGSKNFRFIPIVFPGAKKCHVPTWLQNTHVYGWPRDRDDILRRLMRVEKYNPPPIGELPMIVSIPI